MYADVRVYIRQCHTDEDGERFWNVDETQVKGGTDLFDELEKGAMIVRTEVHQADGTVDALHYRTPDVNDIEDKEHREHKVLFMQTQRLEDDIRKQYLEGSWNIAVGAQRKFMDGPLKYKWEEEDEDD